MNEHEVLVKARNLIDRQGWCKQMGRTPGGQHCLAGALTAVLEARWLFGEIPDYHKVGEHPAGRRLADLFGVEPHRLWAWNDERGRTQDQVLAALDKAIAATAPLPADPVGSVLPCYPGWEQGSAREQAIA